MSEDTSINTYSLGTTMVKLQGRWLRPGNLGWSEWLNCGNFKTEEEADATISSTEHLGGPGDKVQWRKVPFEI